jgi:hypothetical protein
VDDLEDRIEALQSRVSELERLLEAQAGWIVCSERMPNKGDWCWVVWEGSVQHEAWQFLGDHWATWDESADPAKRDEFSHWLLLPPIPHPPSEGEK